MADDTAEPRIGQVIGFATLGVLTTTQEIAGTVLSSMKGATPDVVAEETLALVSVATARAAACGLSSTAVAEVVEASLLDLPFLYREYLAGAAVLSGGDPDAGADIHVAGIARKLDFYTTHLARGLFPGERVLDDKMSLWMGRVSPPGLPEHPVERMRRLELVPMLLGHLKLVLGYCRQSAGDGGG